MGLWPFLKCLLLKFPLFPFSLQALNIFFLSKHPVATILISRHYSLRVKLIKDPYRLSPLQLFVKKLGERKLWSNFTGKTLYPFHVMREYLCQPHRGKPGELHSYTNLIIVISHENIIKGQLMPFWPVYSYTVFMPLGCVDSTDLVKFWPLDNLNYMQ